MHSGDDVELKIGDIVWYTRDNISIESMKIQRFNPYISYEISSPYNILSKDVYVNRGKAYISIYNKLLSYANSYLNSFESIMKNMDRLTKSYKDACDE